jgi:hypothetical protein
MTRKQEAAVAALLARPNLEEAAREAGISVSTLRRWQQLPGFQQALRDARRQLVETTVAWLQATTTKAIATLLKNMDCGRPSVEVSAAVAVLDRALRGHELCDLAAEVEDIKRRLPPEKRP